MKPLQNLTILITRPQHQTDSLINTLKNAGAKTLYFPTLEIKPPHKKPSPQLIEHIKNSDIAIFISVNAVEKAKPYLTHLSAQSTLFAIGPTTAHTLEKTGQAVTFPTTPPFNSEALLALPKLQKVHGKTIILFAGEGGRTTLKDTLTHRGANVFKIEVYRRACPTTRLTTFLEQQPSITPIDFVISTSLESLNNLVTLMENKKVHWLETLQLLVISEHMAIAAKELGFKKPALIATSATDKAIYDRLTK